MNCFDICRKDGKRNSGFVNKNEEKNYKKWREKKL